jgi:UMF1 family MFS transporter
VLIGLPFPIMMLVDVDRGRAEGAALAETLEALDAGRERERLCERERESERIERRLSDESIE